MHTRPGRSFHVAVLGPVLVTGQDGQLVEPPGPRAKTLVVALARAGGRVLSPIQLIEEIWGADAPGSARAALHALVSRTRAVCADGLLVSTAGGYRLDVERERIDVYEARRSRDEADSLLASADAAGAGVVVDKALELWRAEPAIDATTGPAVEDLRDDALALQHALRRLRLTCAVELGDYSKALRQLSDECVANPLDEPLHELLMRALRGLGRQAEALVVYEALRERLDDHLGTAPSASLATLHVAILRAEAEPEPAAAPVAEPVRRHVFGLRAPVNDLLGRAEAVVEVEALMAQARLTTILGAGGLGKTRLAQEVGRRAADVGLPSVVFVELASMRSGADVVLAMASVLGIREPSSSRMGQLVAGTLRDRVVERLAERQTLLIVDNCEHVVDAVAVLVDEILAATDRVQVLATSRAPLAIAAEHVYALDPLPTRAGDGQVGAAVTLFRDRARAARPSIHLDDASVARLCARLDGLPLAIELAAAKVRTMSVEEIERRLDDRFALLTGTDRSAPDRHRTLTAVIDWSWNLLEESQQVTLRRLGRFPDGFGLAAAQEVAGAGRPVEADLEVLVNQSLVAVVEDERSATTRFRMLETVREFCDLAMEAAGETELVHTAMSAWAERFCATAIDRSYGPGQVATMAAVLREQDNLVWVLRLAMDTGRQRTVVVVFALLANFWSLRGMHGEVIGFAPEAIAALRGYEPTPDTADAAVLAYGLSAVMAMLVDRRIAARARYGMRRVVAGGPPLHPMSAMMADVVLSGGRRDQLFAAVERARSAPEPAVSFMGYLVSAAFHENEGEAELATTYAREAFARARRVGEVWGQAMSAQLLAQLSSQVGEPGDAAAWARQSIALLAEVHADGDVQQLWGILAVNEIAAGNVDEGRKILGELSGDVLGRGSGDLVDAAAEVSIMRAAGLAEADLADGHVDAGLARYREAVGLLTGSDRQMSPWSLMIGAAMVCAHAQHDPAAHRDVIAAQVRRLRHQVLARYRWSSAYADLPVTGTVLLGVAVGLSATPGHPGREPERSRVALELLALAERFHARQDYPALLWQPHVDAARRRHGAEAVDAARARVEAMERTDLMPYAIDLLGSAAIVE